MRLIKLRLEKFRRFADPQSLDLNEDLIALVGPNEAGKSSILAALNLLGRYQCPSEADRTRGLYGAASIAGLFVLGDDDREAVSAIHGASEVTHSRVELRSDETGPLWGLTPRPCRDLGPRRSCRTAIGKLDDDPALDVQYSTDDQWPWDPALPGVVASYLESEDETLQDHALDSFESLAQRLQGIQFPPQETTAKDFSPRLSKNDSARRRKRNAAARSLRQLAEAERRPSPELAAISVLQNRMPAIVTFEDADRQLESDYQLAEVAAAPPPALRHLCRTAGLDLAAAQRDVEGGRIPHVVKMVEDANATLRERFEETWSQSKVYPHLSPPTDGVLRVMIATDGGADYSYPHERSDGLRWFMALHAFLAASGTDAPILLVDEAETHLHYDAQADLIDVLMNQEIASKVIYTTHSVGCLPPDLGCGIRAALPESDNERSRIANSYWSVDCGKDDRVGYTPLLFAMGAQLLSLTVPKYAVIAEGPSDAILLPSLLREAGGLRKLPYRVVPGLAELADAHVGAIAHHAGSVVCLTDDDESGTRIRGRLEGSLDQSAIMHLGQVAPGCTLEDLVKADLFAQAVNDELTTWSLGSFRIEAASVPKTGRWKWLEEVGLRAGSDISSLGKVRVAQRMVDARNLDGETLASDVSRVAIDLRRRLGKLHDAIVKVLGVPLD